MKDPVARFNVFFAGELLAGQSPTEVKRRLVALFGSAEKIERLFQGGRVLVKRGVSAEEAESFRGAFARAGARCEVVATEEPRPPNTGKGTIAYGSPEAGRPRRITPVYGSAVFADDAALPALAPTEAPPAPPPAAQSPAAAAALAPPPWEVGASAHGTVALSPVPAAPLAATSPAPAAVPAPPWELAPGTGSAGHGVPAAVVAVPAVAAVLGAIPDLDAPSPQPPRSPGPQASPGLQATPGGSRRDELEPPSDAQASWLVLGTEAQVAAMGDVSGRRSFDLAGDLELAGETTDTSTVGVDPASAYDESSRIDVSLPRLHRDASGQVVAEPPAHPERPARRRPLEPAGGPAALQAPALPILPGASGPAVPATAAPVLRGLRGVAHDGSGELTLEHTPEMVTALERSRFGVSVTAVSLLIASVLLACSAAGSLMTLNLGGLLVGLVLAGVMGYAAYALWGFLKALERVTPTGPTAPLSEALDAAATYWKVWGILNLVSLGLMVLVLALSAVVGGMAARGSVASGKLEVLKWQRRPTAEGFELDFSCSDSKRRQVRCERDIEVGFACTCWVNGAEEGTFDTRGEPMNALSAVAEANQGCGWKLEYEGLR